MIFGLLPLVITIGLVVLVVRAVRGRDADGPAADTGVSVRRFFQYLVAFGLAMVAAFGVMDLLGELLAGPGLVDTDTGAMARAVTFTVIGVPLYGAMMWWLLRQVRGDDAERDSFAWAFHVTAVGLTALVATMMAVHAIASWLLWRRDGSVEDVAALVVWGALWAAYWYFDETLVPERRRTVHVLAGSLVGLGTAAVGLGRMVTESLQALGLPVGEQVLVTGPRSPIAAAALTLAIGVPVWAVYWLWRGQHRERGGLWHAYVLLAGVLGGLATMVVGGAVILYDVLVWLVGEPTAATAGAHFDALPAALGAIVAGALVWWYHRAVLGPRTLAERGEVERVYDHLSAAVGLLAAAGGLATVLVAIIEATTGRGAVQLGAEPINTLLAAVTLLLVGGPIWWLSWQRTQRVARPTTLGAQEAPADLEGAGPPAAGAAVPGTPPTGVPAAPSLVAVPDLATRERQSTSRRVYLFALFGVGGLAAVIALLTAVFIMVEDAMEGVLGAESIRSARFAIAILATAGVVAVFHWFVYRDDRTALTQQHRAFPRNIVLVGTPDPALVEQLSRSTGAHVRLWARSGNHTPAWELESLTEALAATQDDDVLVVARPDGVEVIGVQR